MGRLEGKVAIVTGGARGMGAATCRLFVEEGARVVIGDVLDAEGEALARELGDAARFMRLDVADEANWARVADATVEQFGRIDVLVNNAAVLMFGAITDLSKRDFERAVSINLVGMFVGIRTIAPRMIAQQRGSTVNISSVDGLRGVNALAAYVSSKWGVRGLTKVAALELGHRVCA
jgi:3alpha(or 20beta)-hydroxysteroid dehydrogenase